MHVQMNSIVILTCLCVLTEMILTTLNTLKECRKETNFVQYRYPTDGYLKLHYWDVIILITTLFIPIDYWILVFSCILLCGIYTIIVEVCAGAYYIKKSIVPFFVLLILVNQANIISETYLKSLGFLILSLKNDFLSIDSPQYN